MSVEGDHFNKIKVKAITIPDEGERRQEKVMAHLGTGKPHRRFYYHMGNGCVTLRKLNRQEVKVDYNGDIEGSLETVEIRSGEVVSVSKIIPGAIFKCPGPTSDNDQMQVRNQLTFLNPKGNAAAVLRVNLY